MTNITRVRVVDLSGATLCTGLLRAMGADVRTLDETRHAIQVRRLIENADVLVDGLGQDVSDACGVSPAQLPALNPRLIHCSIAAGGGTPIQAGLSIIRQLAELYAYQQILILLLERRANGRGRRVTIDVHGAFATQLDASVPMAWAAGVLNMGPRPPVRGLDLCTLSARDGLIVLSSQQSDRLANVCFQTDRDDAFDEEVDQAFCEIPVADAVRVLDRHAIPCGGISHAVAGVCDARIAVDTDPSSASESHAAARWARAVVRAIDAPRDPKTLAAWGRAAAAAPGTLANWCRTAGLGPRASLAFARVLRAILWRQMHGRRPEDLLDVVDRRTLAGLLKLGSPADVTPSGLPDTVDDFLRRQQWIVDRVALREVELELHARNFPIQHVQRIATVVPIETYVRTPVPVGV